MDLILVQVRIRKVILDSSLFFFKSGMHFRLNHLCKFLLINHALLDIPEIVLIVIFLLLANSIFKGLIELFVEIGVLILHLDEVLFYWSTISFDLNGIEPIENSWQEIFLGVHDLGILKVYFWVNFVAVRRLDYVFVHESLLVQLFSSVNVRILDKVLSLWLFQNICKRVAFVPCQLGVSFFLLLRF